MEDNKESLLYKVIPFKFLNSYDCPCGRVWHKTRSLRVELEDTACNDKCPKCGCECEPSKSREVTE